MIIIEPISAAELMAAVNELADIEKSNVGIVERLLSGSAAPFIKIQNKSEVKDGNVHMYYEFAPSEFFTRLLEILRAYKPENKNENSLRDYLEPATELIQ